MGSDLRGKGKMINSILHTHYKIIELLGSGAFGQTYLAKNLSLPNEPVCVIKQLKPHHNNSVPFKTAKALFDREIETLHRVANHPQIPQILDNFEQDQEFYFVQEYIDGETLREEFNHQKSWDESQAIVFLKEILQILEFIHSQGIIHRDIKPENIIRRTQDQKLFLIDFGAVKQIASSNHQQASSTIIHSRGYTPPEQLAGIPELNSDIYALGMTCIEALTNIKPESLTQLRDAQTQEITWAENIRISDQFKLILSRMVCIDSRNRYPNSTPIIQDLNALESVNGPSNASSNYSPTEILIAEKNDSEESTDSRDYIPTEWKNYHSKESSSDEKTDEEFELDLETCSTLKTSEIQSQNKLNPQDIFQNLHESLKNQQKIPQLIKLTNIIRPNVIRQFLKKKLIIASSSLIFIGIGIAIFSVFVDKKLSSTTQASPPSDSINHQIGGQINFEEQSNLREHRSVVKFLAFTPDGKTLISAGEAGTIKLRDLSNQSVKSLTQTQSKILAVSSSANGKILAIATEDKFIKIWNLTNRQKVSRISAEQLTWSLALNHDGQILAAGGLGMVRLWKQIQTQPKQYRSQFSDQTSEPIQSLAFGDADSLVAGSADGTVKIANSAMPKVQTFHKHSKAINSIAFEANGAILFTGSEDNTIRIWNLQPLKGHTLPAIQTDLGGVKTVASSPAGRIIAAGGVYGIQLWDWHTGQSIASFSNHAAVTAVTFSPDGRILAMGDSEGKIVTYVSK